MGQSKNYHASPFCSQSGAHGHEYDEPNPCEKVYEAQPQTCKSQNTTTNCNTCCVNKGELIKQPMYGSVDNNTCQCHGVIMK
jgi:hypothetical protein